VEDIQPWITRHFVEYLAKKGRRTIGWDEIFVDSKNQNAKGDAFTSMLPKSTMGMCWRNHGAGALAANKGYEIVRCPTSHCYFDYRQGLPEDPYIYIGGRLPLKQVYAFDPYEGVAPEARKNVVGGQCCNWTSHTWNRYDMEWKLWPRGFAMAEVLWTYPDPKRRDFAEFSKRAAEYRRRLIKSHVNCAPLR
jgi:hexosaminidase